MRIAHVTTFEKGGAARSALRLHAALLKLGHDSRVLTLEKVSEDPTIRSLKPQYEQAATESSILFREFQSWYIQHNRTEVSNTFFSLNEPGLDISSAREIQEADMIHLHWVSGFLSPGSIARLQKLGKPIFWTLHDQRPFTGGCHFSAGCLKFQADCHGCPQLDYDPYLLTKAQLRDAADQLHYGGIQFCSPSQWLADYAESSALLAKQKVKVIPYGIDADIFKPSEKTSARAALDLPREGIFLLFSADNANEKRKGFPLLMAALRECQANSEIKKLIV
ncbi:MAG: glycosyltransferase, partial [Verrucomicrobiales bacterium]